MPHFPETVREALSCGRLIVTPTDRSARQLRAEHDREQIIAAGQLPNWQPPNVLPFATWLRTLWSGLLTEGHEPRLLLNPAQEHKVWCEVIESGPAFESMGTLDSLAGLAAAAWSRSAAYALPVAELQRAAATHDARLFAAWSAGFVSLCKKNQYVSAAELPQALITHLESGTLEFQRPAEILLYGFPAAGSALATDVLSPTRAALLDSMGERGTNISYVAAGLPHADTGAQNATMTATRASVSAPDPQTELRTAVRWIRSFIEQRVVAGLSHSVALVVPALEEEALSIETVLREVLAPELQLISADLVAAPYAFAQTSPLDSTTMIATALDLLRWAAGPLPLQSVSALLLSPCLGTTEDLDKRAVFDAFTLRSAPLLRPELDLETLIQLAFRTQKRSSGNAEIRSLLQTWNAALHPLATARMQSYADWAAAIRAALKDAGWPGDRALTATSFAHTRAWDHVLDLVSTLDFAPARVDFQTVLAAIERAAQQAVASLPDTAAPVQVLSPADASGCVFDAVVLLHATDDAWLRPERANPLIAFALQRERRMPGADPGLTALRAQQQTTDLAASAPVFLAFHADQNAEGKQRLSPLIAELGLRSLPASDLLPPEPAQNPVREEIIEDTAPIPPLPPGQTRGGAMVLELQAACAFHAFAAFRLNANSLEGPDIGFNARELGSFLHQSLDNFWSDVRSQAALRALSYDERRGKLEAAVERAAVSHPPALTAWDAAYLDLQKTRMVYVLMQWLQEELKRGPFEVVDREKNRELTVGPLTLNVRLDRIDAVDGGTLLVDYKTGLRGAPPDWLSERPDAPQLPLYALLPEADNLQGLAFAKVRAGKEMKWQGYSPPGVLPRPAPMPAATWEEQRAEWRQTLEALAQDFFAGDATVSPKNYPTTCTHCAHRLLCRVSGPMLEAATGAAEPADEEHDDA